MTIPLRILRAAIANRDPAPPILSPRQLACLERIRVQGQKLLARRGFANLTPASLARELAITRAALQFHYADLHALLGDLLRRHMASLAAELDKISPSDPDHFHKCRVAWRAYTSCEGGGFTDAHLLLVRDRHMLAPDELDGIERTYQDFERRLGGPNCTGVLCLLDNPELDLARVEACLSPSRGLPPPPTELRPQPAVANSPPAAAPPGKVGPSAFHHEGVKWIH